MGYRGVYEKFSTDSEVGTNDAHPGRDLTGGLTEGIRYCLRVDMHVATHILMGVLPTKISLRQRHFQQPTVILHYLSLP